MKCILCDRCKQVIENPRHARVITCARPFGFQNEPTCSSNAKYRGNDPKMNDILWEKELCGNCLDDLEAFLATDNPVEPDDTVDTDNSGSAGNDSEPTA